MKKHTLPPLPNKNEVTPVNGSHPHLLSVESPKPLTPKETKVLDFLTEYFITHGHSPSYQEIKSHFNLASFNSVQNYLKQLCKKNYIQLFPHQKRCIEIIKTSDFLKEKLVLDSSPSIKHFKNDKNSSFSKKAELSHDSSHRLLQKSLPNHEEVLPSPLYDLPFLGRVAAGNPIERVIDNETISIPPHLVKKPDSTFILSIEGESMIDEGINPNDLILVQEQSTAKNGDIVVVSVDNEATVKRIYFNSPHKTHDLTTVELRPSNKAMKSLFYPKDSIHIRGLVIGLIRKF